MCCSVESAYWCVGVPLRPYDGLDLVMDAVGMHVIPGIQHSRPNDWLPMAGKNVSSNRLVFDRLWRHRNRIAACAHMCGCFTSKLLYDFNIVVVQ